VKLALLFEKMVVDDISGWYDGILSSTDIPGVLKKKGWDFRHVAAAWRVSSEPIQWDLWSYGSLDYLGGKIHFQKYGVS